MTRFVGTPLTGIEFASTSSEAISARVNGDAHARIRIDAGGRLTWSAGNAAGDSILYRSAVGTLTTDTVFKATGGLITLVTDGAPTAALADGAIAVDATNDVLYFRSGGAWTQVTGGGASISISDTPPSSPSVGDLWYESDTGKTFVRYDSHWVEVGGNGGPVGAGVASGGTAGQVLVKTSSTDYATSWSSIWEDDQTILASRVFG